VGQVYGSFPLCASLRQIAKNVAARIETFFPLTIAGRYRNRHKGEYRTREDEGAHDAFDADTAVLQGRTGHQVEKKKEWFI